MCFYIFTSYFISPLRPGARFNSFYGWTGALSLWHHQSWSFISGCEYITLALKVWIFLNLYFVVIMYDIKENKHFNTLNGYIVVFFFFFLNCECTGVSDSPAGFWFSTTSAGGVPEKDTGLTVLCSLSFSLAWTNTLTDMHTSHTHKNMNDSFWHFCLNVKFNVLCRCSIL